MDLGIQESVEFLHQKIDGCVFYGKISRVWISSAEDCSEALVIWF